MVAAHDWVQPPRSPANIDALARVQILRYTFAEAGDIQMEYGLFLPTTYKAGHPTPLVIALHGAGGGVNYMMEYNNLLELAERYGYIVATPMGYNTRGWFGSRGPGNDFSEPGRDPGPSNLGYLSEQDVLNVLRIVRGAYTVDNNRIYLIGQSMGGGGVLYLGSKFPQIWAALAAMAPAIYSDPDRLTAARHIPVMIVQGDADQAVDVRVTRRWAAKMKDLGMEGEYIEVPGGSHASAGRENIGKVFAFLDKHRRRQ